MDVKALVGARLPDLDLPDASGPGEVRLRPHTRDATVALLLPPEPPDLDRYLRSLGEAESEMRRWDGRLLLVAEGEPRQAEDEPGRGKGEPGRSGRTRVAADPEGVVRGRLGLSRGTVALVIADRFGEIFHAVEAERGAAPDVLPAADELLEWLKYLTTQCPECGVIDAPGYGEWAPPEPD